MSMVNEKRECFDWEEDQYCQDLGIPEYELWPEDSITIDWTHPRISVEVAFDFIRLKFPEVHLCIDERFYLKPYAKGLDYLLSERVFVEIECQKTGV